ncbi:hypothetical protein HDU91_004707, partial [Kappamyces sp. JEL0680]
MRDYNAYLTPSGIFTGMALYELFSAWLLLFRIPNKNTGLWKMSLVTSLLMIFIVVVDMVALDYLSSPYVSPSWFIGTCFVAAYFFNIFGTVLLAVMFLMRIKIFYGVKSNFYKSMMALSIVMIAVKGAGDALGVYVSYSFANGSYSSPVSHPLYKDIPLVLAIATTLEGIFSAAGSISFLYYLTDFNGSNWSQLREKVFMKEGSRLVLIVCIHAVIVYLGICVYFDDNYISHCGFFLPALAYSLELNTFLDLSYNSAKEILSEAQSAMTKQTTSSNRKTLDNSE